MSEAFSTGVIRRCEVQSMLGARGAEARWNDPNQGRRDAGCDVPHLHLLAGLSSNVVRRGSPYGARAGSASTLSTPSGSGCCRIGIAILHSTVKMMNPIDPIAAPILTSVIVGTYS